MNKLIYNACQTIVKNCADLTSTDRALIISDEKTSKIGELIAKEADKICPYVKHYVISPFTMHGQEPDENIADEMKQHSVIFGLTSMSMAHTKARLDATESGARYLSLPDYSKDVLTSSAFLVDFRKLTPISTELANMFTDATNIRIKTELGTCLECNISGRTANAAPGWCNRLGVIASPPNAESNIAPIEEDSSGSIIVDGSIPCEEFGLLHDSIKLDIKQGRVFNIEGKESDKLNALFDSLDDQRTRVIAELGVGLNPLAKLKGHMLEDEGCLGTVHIGIGSNVTIGGKNNVPFHLDHVIRNATIELNDKIIMKNGKFTDKNINEYYSKIN